MAKSQRPVVMDKFSSSVLRVACFIVLIVKKL